MRFIISLPLFIVATALFCHGHFLSEEAAKGFASARTTDDFRAVAKAFPYSERAAAAHEKVQKSWETSPPNRVHGSAAGTALHLFQGGFTERAPWMLPRTAAAIGVLGLLLALFMPRQRGRSFVLLALLASAAVASPLLMGEGMQAGIIDSFEPSGTLMQNRGYVAIGLLGLAGLALSQGRSRRPADYD